MATEEEKLFELIDAYWDRAHAEGKKGRTVDTPAGDAAVTRARIADAISRLVGERDEARALSKEIYDRHGATIDRANHVTAALTAADARVAQLETALKPFASEASRYDPDDGDGAQRAWHSDCTIADFRRARTALSQPPDRESGT